MGKRPRPKFSNTLRIRLRRNKTYRKKHIPKLNTETHDIEQAHRELIRLARNAYDTTKVYYNRLKNRYDTLDSENATKVELKAKLNALQPILDKTYSDLLYEKSELERFRNPKYNNNFKNFWKKQAPELKPVALLYNKSMPNNNL